MGVFHDGASGEARASVAIMAPTNAGAIGEAIRLSECAVVVINESVAPSSALKIGCAVDDRLFRR